MIVLVSKCTNLVTFDYILFIYLFYFNQFYIQSILDNSTSLNEITTFYKYINTQFHLININIF